MKEKPTARNIAMTVAYDGGDFHGFQSQRALGLPTIQQSLEDALYRVLHHPVEVIGSGRTDAGVHAWGQVVNFQTSSTLPPNRYPLALPPYLPETIRVLESREVPDTFHARFNALDKTYVYQYYCAPLPSPFFAKQAYYVRPVLDIEAMNQGAAFFVGTHDFQGFCSAQTPAQNFIRKVSRCCVESCPVGGFPGAPAHSGDLVTLTIQGSGFLWNMVRIIAGTLLYVGKGKLLPEDIPVILAAKDRRLAGKTLSPHGLFLYEVRY